MRLQTEPNVTALPLVGNEVPHNGGASYDVDALLKTGVAAAQHGEREFARISLTKVTEIDPQCEDAWMWLASISEYPEELLALLQRVLDINPDNQRAIEWRAATRSLMANTFVERAIAAREQGSMETFADCLAEALQFDDNCEAAWCLKAELATGEDERCACFERILEINPKNQEAADELEAIRRRRLDAFFAEAKAAAVAGKRKKALDLVDEFLKSVPENAEAWVLRSHLALDLEEKMRSLESALAIEPDNATAKAGFEFLKATLAPAEALAEEPFEAPVEMTAEAAASAEAPPFDVVAEEVPVVYDDAGPVEAVEAIADGVDLVYEEPFDFDDQPIPTPFGGTDMDDDAPIPAPSDEELFAALDAVIPDTRVDDPLKTFVDVPDTFVEVRSQAEGPANEDQVPDTFVEARSSEEDSANEDRVPDTFVELQPQEEALGDEDQVPDGFVELAPSEEVPENDDDVIRFVVDIDQSENGMFEPENAVVEQVAQDHPAGSVVPCPFCMAESAPQSFQCVSCSAVLSLSDIESLISNGSARRDVIQEAVSQMEAEWNLREFNEDELTMLAIGHFNLRNFRPGFTYLQEASRLSPNNVILAGQVNALQIRIDEISRQNEINDSKPKGKTILVVDDSPTVRKLISGKLEKSGHNVVCASDGVEALERMQESLPDLVLLDIAMPRMDGYEVCKQIRANPAAHDLPVVMISGKDGFFDKVRGRMAGTSGYVTKPFGPETLMKALETYLRPEVVQ